MTAEERVAPLALSPEMATLTTGSVNFGDGVFLNILTRLDLRPPDAGTRGQTGGGGVRDGNDRDGPPPGQERVASAAPPLRPGHGGARRDRGTPENLLAMVDSLPSDATWSVAGIGRTELPLGAMAVSWAVMSGWVLKTIFIMPKACRRRTTPNWSPDRPPRQGTRTRNGGAGRSPGDPAAAAKSGVEDTGDVRGHVNWTGFTGLTGFPIDA